MADNVLKGNFKTKREVKATDAQPANSLTDMLKQRALASLGGSMIYVDRTALDWDPDAEKK